MKVEFFATASGAASARARDILRRCVHCGFCNSACPTYHLSRDELNGPRGRIYQMKNYLEGRPTTAATLQNLDQCLTCQACETACPSGVRYLDLLDYVRPQAAKTHRRGFWQILRRRVALFILLKPALLKTAVAILAVIAPLLPAPYRVYLPPRRPTRASLPPPPTRKAAKTVILYEGCAQGAMRPEINAHATDVLTAMGMTVRQIASFCCGALELHLEAEADAARRFRANVDVLYDALQNGATHVVSIASGCGRTVAHYGELLQDDPAYAEKAAAVSAAHCDLSALLRGDEDLSALRLDAESAYAFHCPCTLKNAGAGAAAVPEIFSRLGGAVKTPEDNGYCCGSAGFYSAEHPHTARALRQKRLDALNGADEILTANIGCLLHLQSGTKTPVKHWIQAIHPVAAEERQ